MVVSMCLAWVCTSRGNSLGFRISRDARGFAPFQKERSSRWLIRTSTVNEDPVIALNLHLPEPRHYRAGLRDLVIGPFPRTLPAGDITTE